MCVCVCVCARAVTEQNLVCVLAFRQKRGRTDIVFVYEYCGCISVCG